MRHRIGWLVSVVAALLSSCVCRADWTASEVGQMLSLTSNIEQDVQLMSGWVANIDSATTDIFQKLYSNALDAGYIKNMHTVIDGAFKNAGGVGWITQDVDDIRAKMLETVVHLQNIITELQSLEVTANVDLGNLEGLVDSIQNEVEVIRGWGNQGGVLTLMQASLDLMDGWIGDIMSDINLIEPDVDTIRTTASTISSTASTISTRVSQIQTDVTAMRNSLSSSIQGDIDVIQQDIDHLDIVATNLYTKTDEFLIPYVNEIRQTLLAYFPVWGALFVSMDAHAAAIEADVEAIKSALTSSAGSVSFVGPDNEVSQGEVVVGDILEAWDTRIDAFPPVEHGLPKLTPGSKAPYWQFNLPVGNWFAGTGMTGLQNFNLVIDWSFWEPYRALAHSLLMLTVGLWCSALVWEEVRKYG